MRLVLYHDNRDPFVLMNTIKVTIDNDRTLTVRIKERRQIRQTNYNYPTDYQRLTIEVD